MERQYELKSIKWAIFEDGKVIPFMFNEEKTKMRVFGNRINMDYLLELDPLHNYMQIASNKLTILRNCKCIKIEEMVFKGSKVLATKDEILNIAASYENIARRNLNIKKTNQELAKEPTKNF